MTSGNLDWTQQANSLDKSADLMGFLLRALVFLVAILILGLIEWLASRRETSRTKNAATPGYVPGTADAISRPT